MPRAEAWRSFVQRLFAERHIYVRSGPESRYVVISSALQAGVTGFVLLALLVLGGTLYSAIDRHSEVAEGGRDFAGLANREAAARIDQLSAQRERAEAARATAEEGVRAAAAERDRVKHELALARAEVDDGATRLAALEIERDSLLKELEPYRATAAVEAEQAEEALRAEVAELRAVRTTLEAELEQVQERIAALQAENEHLAQTTEDTLRENHALQVRVQEAEAVASEPVPGSGEADRFQEELAQAKARLAEMDRARLAAVPGPDVDRGDRANEGLRSDLQAARERIAELERVRAFAPARLVRGPVAGDGVLASDFSTGEGEIPVLAPVPAYQAAVEEVTALGAELAAAGQLAGLVADGEGETLQEPVRNLRVQIESAGARIQDLNATLSRLKERDVALQRALATLAPLPPPAAPR